MVMQRKEIEGIIPHRDGMLLIDEVEHIEPLKSVAKYTVRGDEWFLQGHFPGNPIVPGVILCEIMAQSSSVILKDKLIGKTPYFTSMNNVRFKKMVKPGDVIKIEAEVTKERGPFVFFKCSSKVENELAASGEFSIALIDN